MINKTMLIGRTGKDAEIVNYDGGKIAKFSLAVSEKYKNKAGETVEETEWFNVVIYGKLADVAEKYIKKGDLLYIEGKIKTRKYDDKEGITRTVTDVICQSLQMLGGKSGDQGKKEAPSPKQSDNPFEDEGPF